MTLIRKFLFCVLFTFPIGAHANSLEGAIQKVEARLKARVGIAVLYTLSGMAWSHRGDERFLMNSTIKVPLCAAVLSR